MKSSERPERPAALATSPLQDGRDASPDALEHLIQQHWPDADASPAFMARLQQIPLQFPQSPPERLRRAELRARLIWPWLLGGGLATASALGGFAVGALGLVGPAAPVDLTALAFGVL